MTELIAVITITVLAVISPGPDFAMVTRNSLLFSRRMGVLTAIGIGGGVLVHVGYTVLGVGLLVRQSIWLFGVLKLTGAAYLVWLGIGMMRSRHAVPADCGQPRALSDFGALRMGFFTNALNPKTTIFIVSLFMQVVHPDTPMSIAIGYGLFISMTHVVWFAVLAFFFSTESVRLRVMRARRWIDRIFGALLLGFGALLASASLSR